MGGGGETEIGVRFVFCGKFNSEQLLFEAFFNIICIICCVQPQSESTSSFQYVVRYEQWKSLESPSSTPGGDRDMRSLRFLWAI